MYASGSASSRTARLLLRQSWLVSSPQRRLSVARRMYDRRFPDEDTSRLTMQQLRGREGARVRACYREHSLRTGVPWTRREYTAGQAFGAGDDVNRMLSAANASLYGVVHSAVKALGCSPGLGFVHTGHAHAFVHDMADLYKASVTIPAAFDAVAAGKSSEWSRLEVVQQVVLRVLPAYAGVVPSQPYGRALPAGRFSPPTRGWSDSSLPGPILTEVLPAYAGVVPSSRHAGSGQNVFSPPTRGGPKDPQAQAIRTKFSPPTRGWSEDVAGGGVSLVRAPRLRGVMPKKPRRTYKRA